MIMQQNKEFSATCVLFFFFLFSEEPEADVCDQKQQHILDHGGLQTPSVEPGMNETTSLVPRASVH